MLASRVLQPGRWTLVVTILRCILNKQFYEASGSPVVILGASGPVLLSCHSRFARKPRFSARPCSSRSHSCHLPFAQQHCTLGWRRRQLPYDFGSFVFFAWWALVPIYLFSTRGWRGIIPLGWFVLLYLAAALFGNIPSLFLATRQ